MKTLFYSIGSITALLLAGAIVLVIYAEKSGYNGCCDGSTFETIFALWMFALTMWTVCMLPVLPMLRNRKGTA